MWGGKAEKEGGGGLQGKGCRSFIRVCLAALCGKTEEKREVGMEGWRERERWTREKREKA